MRSPPSSPKFPGHQPHGSHRCITSRTTSTQSHAQNGEPTAPRDSSTSLGKTRATSVMTSGQTPAETGSRRAGLDLIANPRRGPSRRGLSVACGEGVSSGRAELVAGLVEGHRLRSLGLERRWVRKPSRLLGLVTGLCRAD